jgi:diaminopimelate decarboxylase
MSLNQQFPGEHIQYIKGSLHLGGVNLQDLVRHYGSPLYVYDLDRIRARCAELRLALDSVSKKTKAFFAVKALGNLSILREIYKEQFGMDVVSGGEIERCLAAGVPACDIVFSGVAKSSDEIKLGVEVGIGTFNIESPHELELIAHQARRLSKIVSVALRYNPDIDGETHAKINTGLATTKFGLNPSLASEVAGAVLAEPSLRLSGLTCHIGSQITSMALVRRAAEKIRSFALHLMEKGAPINHIDMGGGLAVPYRPEEVRTAPSFEDWVQASSYARPSPEIALHLEPGRAIVADAGVLLTHVIDVKSSGGRRFALVDAGMTELVRPAMYDAYHHILSTVGPHDRSEPEYYDVVGPVCETSCIFAQNVPLPNLAAGSVLAVLTCGAYGMSMASNYNSRPRPAEVAVENRQAHLIRRRETLSSLWDAERFS